MQKNADLLKKEQLANIKAHLYCQTLISLRMIEGRRSEEARTCFAELLQNKVR